MALRAIEPHGITPMGWKIRFKIAAAAASTAAETNITLLPPPAIFLLAVATLLRPGPVVHKVSVVDRPADHIPKALTVPRSFSFFAANNEKVLR